ncbi:MAG: M48 family metalloprotease [Acidobacteria bacterium]|nr:M48 family metalloprotease [Acidobacteriota bacterium]
MAVPTTHTMDFFELQDQAHRSTRWLIAYFILAVILIILAIYFAVITIFFGFDIYVTSELPLQWWNPEWFLWVTAAALSVIVIGSVYKVFALSAGGEVVARWLGGRLIDSNTANPQERRLLNVVEEMAIASGTPVPSVYLLEEENSINAFAAGYSPADAVIGVTQGTIQILSRDELQGVIAHEFSHILNGDMRLNLRLIGVLNGILVIAMIGYVILRSTRVSGRRKEGGAAILMLGGALLIIGYVGVFFGKLIKSAVSRQREFLADASAVQFTRNPDGIADALKKIGGLVYGSRIENPKAEEASHLFFSDGMHRAKPPALAREKRLPPAQAKSAFSFMATHPPLKKRIKRIQPSFNGNFPVVELPSQKTLAERDKGELAPFAAQAGATAPKPAASTSPPGAPAAQTIPVIPQEMTQLFGKLTEAHLAYAALLLAALPSQLTASVHEPSTARAIIFALLLSRDSETRRAQFRLLNESKDRLVARETLESSTLIDRCPPETRLPLVDLALPSLRALSHPQYEEFTRLVEQLVEADQKIDLFEYTLHHILRRHLDSYFRETKPPASKYHSLAPLSNEIALLLSSLAHVGHDTEEQARQAFAQGVEELEKSRLKLSLQKEEECGFEALSRALDRLTLVTPLLKRRLLRACGACVSHDYQVKVQEGELLRAIADSLDCPMPPFLAGQTLERSAEVAGATEPAAPEPQRGDRK